MGENDERVAGWLDGSLSAAEAARFEADLASNPELAEQVADWQRNDDLLRAAFNAPFEQEVDDALLARMGLATPTLASAPASGSTEVIDLAARRRSAAVANDNLPRRRWALPLGGAIAAGLALAVVLTGGPSLFAPTGSADVRFAEAMEKLPSRTQLVLPDGGQVAPVLSFAAADGRYCREFTVSGGTRPGGGIACKGSAGWKIEARSAVGAVPADPGTIGMAGGPDGRSLDAAYARLGASDPVSVQTEQRLIAGGWKSISANKQIAE